MKKILLLSLGLMLTLSLAACGADQPIDTTLHIQPKMVKAATPEEKKEIQAKFEAAVKGEHYDVFADLLKDMYAKGWENDQDFLKYEQDLYKKGGEYFHQGLTDQAFKMASAIHPKVYESWRFKYLRILCLEKYGNEALEKKDYAKAQDYAQQIMSIEFRPEGVSLMAKVYIGQAEVAIKAGDRPKARQILLQSVGMEIPDELRLKIDELMKGL